MTNSEKITIAIEKLPAEYHLALMAEMHKEGSRITVMHIEMHHFSTGGQFMALMQ